MKRLRLLGLVLMAVFALGAATAASASASERGVLTLAEAAAVLALGENLANIAVLTASASAKAVECKKLWILHLEMGPTNSENKHFNLSNKDLDIHFSECTLKGTTVKCNTPSDLPGVILLLTLVHLINLLDKEGGNLIPGFAWLILNALLEHRPLLIECGVVKIEVSGAIKGVAEPLNANNVITLTEEVLKAGFVAKTEVLCDTKNETVCQELLKNEPLMTNLGKGPEKATALTELETLTLNTDVLWDD